MMEKLQRIVQEHNFAIRFELAPSGCHHPMEHTTMMKHFAEHPNTIYYTPWYSKDNSTEYHSFFFKGVAEEGLASWHWYDLKNENHVSSLVKSMGIRINRRDTPSIRADTPSALL